MEYDRPCTPASPTYDITCTGAPPAATALATVQFTDVTVTGVGAGKSGGGGGALDAMSSLPLCLLVLRRFRALREFRCRGMAHRLDAE
jgi:hypothetical protein